MTRLDFLNAPDRCIEAVDVPEWHTTLHVRSLTLHERQQLQKAIKGVEKLGGDGTIPVILACVSDENGNAIFHATDTEALENKNGMVLERLVRASLKVNGFDATAVEQAKNA